MIDNIEFLQEKTKGIFSKSFIQYLKESAEMIDISIISADKKLNTEEKKREFLNTSCKITAKTDGVKLTIVKIANNGNLEDWIFSYKGHVLYPGEYDWQPKEKVDSESVGASQFQKVFDHFKRLGKTSIPVGTELQCEFLMRKNTLSSNYEHPHGIVLIQHGISTVNHNSLKYGVLKTNPSQVSIDKREAYAKELGINSPLVLFDGILGSKDSFSKGIKYNGLQSVFDKVKNNIDWENIDNLYHQLKVVFLEVPSLFGGKEEGVVIEQNGSMMKWQQVYQLDQKARAKIKMKYKEDDLEKENAYWINVKNAAYEISDGIDDEVELKKALIELSERMKHYKLTFAHSKKTESQIKDDIQLTAKTLIIKRMHGNNGCLVLGKFRVFSNGHKKVIDTALKEYDNVCVCLVTSAETKATRTLRLKAIKTMYGANPRVEIVEYSGGNLPRIFEKCSFNINAVYTGTDRVESYLKQLNGSIGMKVREIKRNDEDISATKIIEKIRDEKYFKENVPSELHAFYTDYLKAYGK